MDDQDPIVKALEALDHSQVNFLQSLPKAELHAHLNGSIPLLSLQTLARDHPVSREGLPEAVAKGLEALARGVELNEIGDFFGLFPAIYALTSNCDALASVTRDVLVHFLDPSPTGAPPQCQYIELRTTPRKSEGMSRRAYLEAVLGEVEKFDADQAALIVSLDRRMCLDDLEECVYLAAFLKSEGRRVVGIDLCGDPWAGDMKTFVPYFEKAKAAGLKLTVHIAETIKNTEEDTLTLLSFGPDRLGHATFLSPKAREIILRDKIPIEICLTSNLLCKTVTTIDVHHIRWLLQHNHPMAICTDDILPFRNSMLGEYALLMARHPYGLGLTEDEIRRIAEMSFECRFK